MPSTAWPPTGGARVGAPCGGALRIWSVPNKAVQIFCGVCSRPDAVSIDRSRETDYFHRGFIRTCRSAGDCPVFPHFAASLGLDSCSDLAVQKLRYASGVLPRWRPLGRALRRSGRGGEPRTCAVGLRGYRATAIELAMTDPPGTAGRTCSRPSFGACEDVPPSGKIFSDAESTPRRSGSAIGAYRPDCAGSAGRTRRATAARSRWSELATRRTLLGWTPLASLADGIWCALGDGGTSHASPYGGGDPIAG